VLTTASVNPEFFSSALDFRAPGAGISGDDWKSKAEEKKKREG
jgi:hypothetical protein